MNRAGELVEAGPPLQHFLDRFNGNTQTGFAFAPLTYDAIVDGQGAGAFSGVFAPPNGPWSQWIKGVYSRYREGGTGALVGGSVTRIQGGFDYLIGDRLILGVMVQGDGARERSTDLDYDVRGVGWMAGPYVAVRMGEALVIDAKLLWGTSGNRIEQSIGDTPDEFTTSRFLVSARLSGQFVLGPVQVRPSATILYFRETQHPYVDHNSIAIPENQIAFGRVTFGPEIVVPLPTPDGGTMTPSIRLDGVWDFMSSELSARLQAGVDWIRPSGTVLSLSAGIGGLFTPDTRSWNVRLSLTVPLCGTLGGPQPC